MHNPTPQTEALLSASEAILQALVFCCYGTTLVHTSASSVLILALRSSLHRQETYFIWFQLAPVPQIKQSVCQTIFLTATQLRWAAVSFPVTFLYDTNEMVKSHGGSLRQPCTCSCILLNLCPLSLQKEVVVAAERSSAKARLGGRLFVYSL